MSCIVYCISKSVMKNWFPPILEDKYKGELLPSLLNLNFVLINLNNDAQRMLWPLSRPSRQTTEKSLEFLRWVTAHLMSLYLMSSWCYVPYIAHVTRFPRLSLQMFAYWDRKQRPETKASLNQLFSADLDNGIVGSYT